MKKYLKFFPILGMFFAKDYVQGDISAREPIGYWMYQFLVLIVGAVIYIVLQ